MKSSTRTLYFFNFPFFCTSVSSYVTHNGGVPAAAASSTSVAQVEQQRSTITQIGHKLHVHMTWITNNLEALVLAQPVPAELVLSTHEAEFWRNKHVRNLLSNFHCFAAAIMRWAHVSPWSKPKPKSAKVVVAHKLIIFHDQCSVVSEQATLSSNNDQHTPMWTFSGYSNILYIFYSSTSRVFLFD